jgi:hypothetical protein
VLAPDALLELDGRFSVGKVGCGGERNRKTEVEKIL